MSLDPADEALIQRYFDAMRAQADGVDDLLALFADDAEYTEPFSGAPVTHRGKADIERMVRTSQENAPPGLVLHVHRIDLDTRGLFAEWTCESPAFPAPIRGVDRYTLRHGRITRLETTFV